MYGTDNDGDPQTTGLWTGSKSNNMQQTKGVNVITSEMQSDDVRRQYAYHRCSR